MKRRDFIKITAAAGAAALVPWQRTAHAAFLQTQPLLKFGAGQELRMFGGAIPALAPDTATYPGIDYYKIVAGDYFDQLHPALPATHLYGYADATNPVHKHLGGAIIAQKDRAVRITFKNNLPQQHILPCDPSLISPYTGGVDPKNLLNRIAVHLHGGFVPWHSDGGPFHWVAPDGSRGISVVDWLPVDLLGTKNDDYWYPNNQSARMMWYHDHAVGITRMNAYAGLASGYLLKDAAEAVLMNQLGIDASRQTPLVIQDKIFNADGSLWYPTTYDTQFFALAPGLPLPDPSLVPEFWGDTMLVNGSVYPTLKVYPRKYRFEVLNACNTRFINLQLFRAAGKRFPDSAEPNLRDPGPDMLQIGTEGGFLDGSVMPKGVLVPNVGGGAGILLAPAERADIIVDFSKVKPGVFVIMHNDAPVPFPGGTPLADFHPGNNKLPLPPTPGNGPNTRTLMQFYVADPVLDGVPPDVPTDPAWSLPAYGKPKVTDPVPTDLGLYETIDEYGRLTQNLGTLAGPLTYFHDAPTEIVQGGSVVIWRLFNLSADTHPIHFHYFNVRILGRQPINAQNALTGKPIPPDPNEEGWKETVRANPGECLTMLVEIPPVPQVTVPITDPISGQVEQVPAEIQPSPRTGGHEYVWHCHILEHEEHDMMRPLIVV
jgi:spore coat protein A